FRELRIKRAVMQRMRRAAPEESVIPKSRDCANLATNQVENLCRATARDEQPENLCLGRFRLSANEGTGARSPFHETFVLQVLEGTGNGWPGNSKSFHQLRLAG